MLKFLQSPKLIAPVTHGLIAAHQIMRAFSLFAMSGAVFAQVAAAAGPTQVISIEPAHTEFTLAMRSQQNITLFDPAAAPAIQVSLDVTGTTGTPGGSTPSGDKSKPLTNIAGQLIGSIFTIAGIAAAVVASGIGLKILIASGVGSPYGVGQGIMAMLAAGAGLIFAFAGPQVANMIIGATETGGLGNEDPTGILTLPSGAK